MFNYGQEVEVTKGFFTGVKGRIIRTMKELWFERDYKIRLDKPIPDYDQSTLYCQWFKENELKPRRKR